MEQLSATDLHTVLEVAHELGAVQEVAAVRAGVLPQLRRLVPCDAASFNEVTPDAGEAVVEAIEPDEVMFEGAEEVFGAYAHQNPLIAAAQGQNGAEVRKFSDFMTTRALRRLDLYDLLYGPIGVEHQIAFTLPSPSARVVGFALSRGPGQSDFSERDRRVLEMMRPFVVQAYENASARESAQARLAQLQSVLDSGPRVGASRLRELGLTGRESQVLSLVADGLSNVEIAQALTLSERTVAKHLQHVYAKLEVGNRTAALARASESSGTTRIGLGS